MLATILLGAVTGTATGVNVSIDNGAYTRTESYTGQQLLRCGTNSTAAVHAALHAANFDIFGATDTTVDIRVDHGELTTLEKVVGAGSCEAIVADLEASVVAFERDLRQTRAGKNEWFEAYHTYNEITRWYTDVADDFPLITKLVPTIGRSVEGRAMPALHITGTGPGLKKKVWFQCQIHSREWISGATCMYIVDHLVNNYGVEPSVTTILDKVELIVIPFVNPDGYVWTWQSSRLWRKNRSPAPAGSTCIGTDLNRNWDDHWGQGGSSTNPCSDTYMGVAAASEPETRATADYFLLNRPIFGAIDWHAYSQLMLRPYGWSRAASPDEALQKEIGDLMRDEARKVHNMAYTSQPSIDLYTTTGTASDWFYGEDASAGRGTTRAYGFTIELRDTGRYGFELPASQIIPQGQEMIPAVLTFMEHVTEKELAYP